VKTLTVSRATAGFLARGHPWVRPDRFTRGLDRLRAGEPVTLIDQQGKPLASALADPGSEVCARVYHRQPHRAFDPAAALARAWERRAALHADPETDCYRVVHGEADFLPGLRIERYADTLVVLVLSEAIAPHVEAVCAALRERQPLARIVLREHRDDLRRADPTTRRWGGGPLDPDEIVIGRELGVRYPLRPFAGLATGLYVDQRGTRARLRSRASGARVLNLFAYTGAFSVALLAAGAASAVDVDLSAPALARAVETARMNGVAERHRIEQEDCRRFLARLRDEFDLVICDPPTAAQGGGGWVLRRDYGEVLRLALARLAPSGLLVACANTLGEPFPLREAALGAARELGLAVEPDHGFALAEDLPLLKGFPEGQPYRLVALGRT
jgi:23S rRNA (cytosine1962-C5)-methyltransferase